MATSHLLHQQNLAGCHIPHRAHRHDRKTVAVQNYSSRRAQPAKAARPQLDAVFLIVKHAIGKGIIDGLSNACARTVLDLGYEILDRNASCALFRGKFAQMGGYGIQINQIRPDVPGVITHKCLFERYVVQH